MTERRSVGQRGKHGGSSPTRVDKAAKYLEMVSLICAVMDKKHPKDYLVLFTVKYWIYITGWAVFDHLSSTLPMTDRQLQDAVDRLRRRGLLAQDKDTGHISVTQKGTDEFFLLRGTQSRTYKDFQNRHGKSGQSDSDS